MNIARLPKLFGKREDAVIQLAREGKLGSLLLDAIRRKDIPVTPHIKNSIDTVVSAIGLGLGVEVSPSSADLFQNGAASGNRSVVIMFTDIVGSTELVETLGDNRAREVFRAHNEIIRRYTSAHEGTEVKIMGDGFMLTFEGVEQALSSAMDIQRELENYNREHSDVTISVRIGMSVGMPIQEEDDLFGMPVILAARISAQAEGGQILMCQRVHALVRTSPEFTLKELEPVELKGFSGVHTLYEVVWREP